MPADRTKHVQQHFTKDWAEYDRQIRQVIPFYDAALATLIDIVKVTCPQVETILDLGVGTGNLAELALTSFPTAHLTGVDLVQAFIDVANTKLARHDDRVRLLCTDVAEFDFSATYDLVVASFLFHHLEHPLKQELHSRIFSSLCPGGVFVNLDFVHSRSAFFGKVFDALRIESMRAQGVRDDRIRREYIDHRKLEIPIPVEAQLQWLQEAGFVDTECFWKYLNLAMVGGRKR
jgi:tRNA (cmo5U34)-methyltransferase